MKGKPPGGPTTRSRSNITATATEKAPEKATEKENTSILVETPASIKLPPTEGIGSMAAYLAMRERQKKEDLQKNAAISGGSQNANEPIHAVDEENCFADSGKGDEQG